MKKFLALLCCVAMLLSCAGAVAEIKPVELTI